MSDPAHVVISFGKCHIELYRHRGGTLCATGPLLLEVISQAMSAAHSFSAQTHPGGRIVSALLSNTTATMAFMASSKKFGGAVKDDFQFVMGTIGESWDTGYFIQFYPQLDEGLIVEDKGRWLISYCADLEGYETLDDWLPNAQKYSLDEFEKLICKECASEAANEH